MYKKINNNE